MSRESTLPTISTVDRAYLRREQRVAALSDPAWIALIRRLALFFGRIRLTPAEAGRFADVPDELRRLAPHSQTQGRARPAHQAGHDLHSATAVRGRPRWQAGGLEISTGADSRDPRAVQRWPEHFIPVGMDSVTVNRLRAARLYPPSVEPPKPKPAPASPPEREAIASETFWSGDDFVHKGSIRADRSPIVQRNPTLFHRRPRPIKPPEAA